LGVIIKEILTSDNVSVSEVRIVEVLVEEKKE
jgi:hypothetical protein